VIPFRPTAAQVIVTNNCNSRCVTCSQWKRKSTNELTTKEIYEALSQLKDLGIIAVAFSGGEPLLRNDLPHIIKKASQLKFRSISILTNALLLTESQARKLLESGLTGVGISIDGLRETHNQIRGVKGSFDKTITALQILTKLRDQEYPHLEVTKGLKGEPITPYKHSMHRPMLYVDIDDICKAYMVFALKIIEGDLIKIGNSLSHIVNVYYPMPITILELSQIIKDIIFEYTNGEINPQIRIVDKGEPLAFTEKDKDKIRVDITKANKLLGLEKLTNPMESIKKIIEARYHKV